MTGSTAARATLTLRAGEPFVLHIALRDAEGDPQLLSGRIFSLLIAALGATSAAIVTPA
ncbi:MAG: repeat-like protein, partial [Rhizorhabdus sp.]|nr:repeat-like protein [Rhizorhabdus sp.]